MSKDRRRKVFVLTCKTDMQRGFGIETTEHISLVHEDIGFFLTRESAAAALRNLAWYCPTPAFVTELSLNPSEKFE
ncbi:MAG: hypothetical protein DLM73_10455 [Chthoniobacterales bacterium]|nr:MAG: hypothetical protein DLM73_10455 [Chthoniobacterales bacterium]